MDHGLIEIINSLGPSFLEMLSGNQTILYMKNLQPLSGMGLNLADVRKDLIQEKIIQESLLCCELLNSQDVTVISPF